MASKSSNGDGFGGTMRKLAGEAKVKALADRKVDLRELFFNPETESSMLAVALRQISDYCPPEYEVWCRPKPVKWLIEHLLRPQQVGVLTAAGGAGKTTLMIHLACCAAIRLDWFGMKIPKKLRTVVLSLEESQEDLEAVLYYVASAITENPDERGTWPNLGMSRETARMTMLDSVRVIGLRGQGLSFLEKDGNSYVASDLTELLAEALEGHKPNLVILDTLRRFTQAPTVDEQAMALAISEVERLTELTGASVMFLHHGTKAGHRGGATDQYAGHGSGAIVDMARVSVHLAQLDADEGKKEGLPATKDGQSYIRITPGRGSLRSSPLRPFYVLREGYSYRQVEQPRPDSELEFLKRVDAAITGILSKNTLTEKKWSCNKGNILAEMVAQGGRGQKREKALADLARLEREGFIRNDGTPTRPDYRVTEEGRARLDHQSSLATSMRPPGI